jgi:hypothetical protein
MDSLSNTIQNIMAPLVENKYVSTGLLLFGLLYLGSIATPLPKNVMKYLNNEYFRFFILFYISYVMFRDVERSIVSSIIVLVVVYILENNGRENMKSLRYGPFEAVDGSEVKTAGIKNLKFADKEEAKCEQKVDFSPEALKYINQYKRGQKAEDEQELGGYDDGEYEDNY